MKFTNNNIELLPLLDADICKLTEDQYSYQHLKAFGTHNHLISDPWNQHLVYVVDSNWSVQKCAASRVCKIGQTMTAEDDLVVLSRAQARSYDATSSSYDDRLVLNFAASHRNFTR